MVIRKSDERGTGKLSWLNSRHTFSFADYQDPEWVRFGALRVVNEDWIAPESGFGQHPHRDMEIITVMLKGELHHRDSMGHEQVLKAGEVQVMTAGQGVEHSEWNASLNETAHLFQIWIFPREHNLQPAYDQFQPKERDGVSLLASSDHGGLPINQDAELLRIQLPAGKSWRNDDDFSHDFVHVIKGSVKSDSQEIFGGDAVMAAHEELSLLAVENSELLIIRTGEQK